MQFPLVEIMNAQATPEYVFILADELPADLAPSCQIQQCPFVITICCSSAAFFKSQLVYFMIINRQ